MKISGGSVGFRTQIAYYAGLPQPPISLAYPLLYHIISNSYDSVQRQACISDTTLACNQISSPLRSSDPTEH